MKIQKSIVIAIITLAVVVSASCRATSLLDHAGPYEVQILTGGTPARTFLHRGESYVLGQLGERYTIRVWNHSDRRVEAVVSVDGRDVIDGRPADFRSNRGYLVSAWGYVDIDGWRISQGQAATFRFSTVASSYAARTGSARDVGVIGVALFPERYVPPPRPVYAPAADEALPSGTFEAPSEEARGGATARAEAQSAPAPAKRRPGLATEFGEAIDSRVYEVDFVRADPIRPSFLLGVRYNDYQGLVAMGIDVDGRRQWSDTELRRTACPFPMVDRRYAAPPPGWCR